MALGVYATVLMREPFSLGSFSNYVVLGYLFYAAPHLAWAVVAGLCGLSKVVWHAGFGAASIALLVIACFWLGPRDPSGLPMQWVWYWPLAIVLQLVSAMGIALYRRARA